MDLEAPVKYLPQQLNGSIKENRTVAKSLFTRAYKSVQNSIKLNDEWDLTAKKFSDLESRYSDVQEKHEL